MPEARRRGAGARRRGAGPRAAAAGGASRSAPRKPRRCRSRREAPARPASTSRAPSGWGGTRRPPAAPAARRTGSAPRRARPRSRRRPSAAGRRPTRAIRRSPEPRGRAGGSRAARARRTRRGACQARLAEAPAPNGRSRTSPVASAPPTVSTQQPVLHPLVQIHPRQAAPHGRHLPRARPTPARTTRPAVSAPASSVSASASGSFPARPRGQRAHRGPGDAGFLERAVTGALAPGAECAVGAGLGEALAVHRGFRRRGGTHAVGAVAVRAGGRAPVAAGERQEMTVGEPGRDHGASPVAGGALAGLRELVALGGLPPLGRRVADEAADLPRTRAAVGACRVLPVEPLVGEFPAAAALPVARLAAADFAMLPVGDRRDVGVTLAAAEIAVRRRVDPPRRRCRGARTFPASRTANPARPWQSRHPSSSPAEASPGAASTTAAQAAAASSLRAALPLFHIETDVNVHLGLHSIIVPGADRILDGLDQELVPGALLRLRPLDRYILEPRRCR